MTKKNLYEGMFLLDPREAKKGFEACRDFIQKLVGKHGAEPRVIRKWDERKLAYPIQKQKRALYMLTYFDAPGEAVVKIERDAQLSETVLRCLVVRAESVPEKVMEQPFDAPIAPQVDVLPIAEEVVDPEVVLDTPVPAVAAAVKEVV